MPPRKRSEEEGPRIHRTDERDEFEKHPNKVFEQLDDELADEDLWELDEDLWDEEEEDNLPF